MKNKLMKKGDSIIRVLDEKENKVFVIDCIKKTMPYWCDIAFLDGYELCLEDVLTRTEESLSAAEKRIMHERYTLIAGILPFVSDEKLRSHMISKVSEQMQVSKQTILVVRNKLICYLHYQLLRTKIITQKNFLNISPISKFPTFVISKRTSLNSLKISPFFIWGRPSMILLRCAFRKNKRKSNNRLYNLLFDF